VDGGSTGRYGPLNDALIVKEGNDAHRALGSAGFEVGDALLAVNGHAIFGLEGLVALLNLSAKDEVAVKSVTQDDGEKEEHDDQHGP